VKQKVASFVASAVTGAFNYLIQIKSYNTMVVEFNNMDAIEVEGFRIPSLGTD
jgi:hypothetical protein